MPYLEDRATFVIVVLVVLAPVLALVSRRRWRLEAAKREEVMRLAMLAAEETARAEIEANYAYAYDKAIVFEDSGGGDGIARVLQCAVCYSPTTTRCSRCKAVRYCSGKCQIMHWRRGHKEECRPPEVVTHYNTQERISDSKGVQAELSGLSNNNLETGGNTYGGPFTTFSKTPAASESNCSSEDSSEDDNHENKSFDTSGTDCTSNSTTISLSSCSAFLCPEASFSREVEPAKLPLPGFGTTSSPVHTTKPLQNGSECEEASPDSYGPQNSVGGNSTTFQKCQEGDYTRSRVKHFTDEASPLEETVQFRTRGRDSVQSGGSDLKASVRKVVQKIKSSTYSRHQPSRLGSYSGKYNSKMQFPYDLFVKLYNCDKVELRPCGLANCGNSCYANAVLHCLAFTRPLTTYLLKGLHTNTCPKQNWCFTCELESLLMEAKQGKSPLSPVGIISHIPDIGSNLGHGRQEDAHEFLRYAIEAMQSACLKEAGANAGCRLIEETTLVQLTFGGYLRSKIKCMRCKGKSERQERMMDLTVEINGDIGTLEQALERFTSTEILDGDNKYRCSSCKSYERAKKKMSVWEAPNILTIVLKRFQSGKFGKINKRVEFPEYLNLAPYMWGTDDKFPVYKLYAVVVHLDVMNAAFSGHYVCYVKDTLGKWYKIDDAMVKPVELEKVLKQGAYMLFYARCSPRSPSLLRKSTTHDQGNMKSRCQEYPHKNSASDSISPRPCPSRSGSFSDSSSLFSFSDGGSWSTDSTRDSTTSAEDLFSEYLFGESGSINWNSPQRFSDPSLDSS